MHDGLSARYAGDDDCPQPDWFAGVSGLSLVDGDGEWIDELTVNLYPLDAGSDSGSNYASPNQDTSPKEAISGLQGVAPSPVLR